MSRPKNSLLRNVLANFGGYVTSIVITFLISPLIVRSLGDSRYGVWAMLGQLTGYYSLLDIGVRGAVSQYVARLGAAGDREALRRLVSSAMWVLGALSILVAVAGTVIAILLPRLFDLGGVDVSEARIAMFVMTLVVGLELPMAIFQAVLVGNRRFDLLNLIDLAARVLSAALVYVSLRRGGGLVEMSLIQCAASVLSWALSARAAQRIAEYVRLPLAPASPDALRQLLGYGWRNAIINLSQLFIWRIDLVVIGALLGVKWVTYYSIGASLVNYAWSACTSLTLSYTPHFTHLDASGDHDALRRTYLQGTRLVGLLAMAVFANLVVFGRSFIALWLGQAYVSGSWGYRSDTILAALTLASVPSVLQSISRQLLFAVRRQRVLMLLMLGEATCNVLLSLALARRFGPVGVAVGTMVPMLVTNGLLLPAYVLRVLGIGWREYVRDGLGRPLLLGTATLVVGLIFVGAKPPQSWATFFLWSSVGAAFSITLAGAVGVTAAERAHWVARLAEMIGRSEPRLSRDECP